MVIRNLIIYPIKSFSGVEKHSWPATKSGFAYDRHWMLVDENFRFLTLREIPDLRLFKVDVDDTSIKVENGEEQISWEISTAEKKIFETKVWDDEVRVHKVEGPINQFLSDLLHKKVTLVKQVDKDSRMHYAKKINQHIPVSLADGYPYLVLGTSSLEALNKRMEQPVTFQRFRPNLLIETNSPHEEDNIETLTGENVKLVNIKPCARCQVINLDLENGVFQKNPLKTLASYRGSENKLYFGTNMMCVQEGVLSKGEKLYSK